MPNSIIMCQIIKIGENGSAIICGCKKDHECNEVDTVLLLESGERVKDTKENQVKYRNEIRGGSVSCSICGMAAIDNAMWL